MALGIILCIAMGVDKPGCVKQKRGSGAHLNFRGRMKKRSQQRRATERKIREVGVEMMVPHRSRRVWKLQEEKLGQKHLTSQEVMEDKAKKADVPCGSVLTLYFQSLF